MYVCVCVCVCARIHIEMSLYLKRQKQKFLHLSTVRNCCFFIYLFCKLKIRQFFYLSNNNFIQHYIYHFAPLTSAIFQATS